MFGLRQPGFGHGKEPTTSAPSAGLADQISDVAENLSECGTVDELPSAQFPLY